MAYVCSNASSIAKDRAIGVSEGRELRRLMGEGGLFDEDEDEEEAEEGTAEESGFQDFRTEMLERILDKIGDALPMDLVGEDDGYSFDEIAWEIGNYFDEFGWGSTNDA